MLPLRLPCLHSTSIRLTCQGDDLEKETARLNGNIAELEMKNDSGQRFLKQLVKRKEESMVGYDVLKLEVKRLREMLNAKGEGILKVGDSKTTPCGRKPWWPLSSGQMTRSPHVGTFHPFHVSQVLMPPERLIWQLTRSLGYRIASSSCKCRWRRGSRKGNIAKPVLLILLRTADTRIPVSHLQNQFMLQSMWSRRQNPGHEPEAERGERGIEVWKVSTKVR